MFNKSILVRISIYKYMNILDIRTIVNRHDKTKINL